MHAAKVESIAQLPAGGGCFVVAIGKFALVAYQTARHTSQLISVAAIVSGFLVFVAKESIYSVLDTVGAAKCAYNSRLFGRVSLLLDFVRYNVALSAG